MALDSLPMMEVLNLAIGAPDDGCINLRMLYAFLRQLMISGKMENVVVNLKDFTGLPEGTGTGAGELVKAGIAQGGNAGDVITDLWQHIQLKKQVEANKTGIDNLFAMAGKIIDTVGDGRVVTWEGLGDALTGFEPTKASGLVRETAVGLDKAKQYVKDPVKQEELMQKKAKILDKFERISTAISRRSSKSQATVINTIDDDDDDTGSDHDNDDDNSEDGNQPKEGAITGESEELEKKRKNVKMALKKEEEDPTLATLTMSNDTLEEDITEKTVNTLGKVALLHGTNEARLNAIDEQLQNLIKFKKTASYMLQDLDIKGIHDKIGLLNGSDVKSLNDLLKQLTETGGMEQLQNLIKSINSDGKDEKEIFLDMQEKLKALETGAMMGGLGLDGLGLDGLGLAGRGTDGRLGADGYGADGYGADGMTAAETQARIKGGLSAQARKMVMAERKMNRVAEELKSTKQQLKNLMELVADLMKDMNAGKEMEGKMNELKDMANKLQEELGKQNDLIMSMTNALSEYGAAIEMLKRQVRHLQDHKADKSWVMKELALKADLSLLDNYVTKDDFEDMLDDFGKSMNDLQTQQTSLNRLFDGEMKKVLDELMKRMTLEDFDSFRKNVNDGLDQLKRRLDWIAGVAGGEEEAAGMRINKFHCISCDRPVHALAGQQPTTTVPALPGLNTNKSANPFRVLQTAKTRQAVNANNNNCGPLPDPRTSNYGKTVWENETQWKKRRDFCLNRKYGKQDPILANRRDIFDTNNPAYYRIVGPDKAVDIWRQNRGCGGETTLVRPWQKKVGDGGSGGGDGGGLSADDDDGDGGNGERSGQEYDAVEAFMKRSRSRRLNKNNNNDPILHGSLELSNTDTNQAIGVVAVPVDMVDQNMDIKGLSNRYYAGHPNEETLHASSPVRTSIGQDATTSSD